MSEERRDRSRSRDRAPPANAQQGDGEPDVYNCYLTNLGYDITEDMLRDYFAKVGDVYETSLVRDPLTKRPRGFGFVSFKSEEDFRKALELNNTDWNGRNIRVEPAKRKTGWKPTPGEYKGDPKMAASDKYRAGGGGGGGGGRGRGYDDRGRGYDDRGRGYDDRGRGYDDRGRGYDDRGRGYDDRGRGYDDRDR